MSSIYFFIYTFFKNIYDSYAYPSEIWTPQEFFKRQCENRNISDKQIYEINYYINHIINSSYFNPSTNIILHEEFKALNYIITIYSEPPDYLQFDCYEKVKEITHDDELMVIRAEYIKQDSKRRFYSLFNLYTLETIAPDLCKTVIVEEDLYEKLIDEEDYLEAVHIFLTKQGINIFNISDDFYWNICFNYVSPNGKDIPLKIRIKDIYPNISLCDDGCEFIGVELSSLKVKCLCALKYFDNILYISDVFGKFAIADFIEENFGVIHVIKCFKDIFDRKRFSNCIGGFIIISLFILEIICYIKFTIDGFNYIRKYLDTLTQSFIDYIDNNNNIKPSNNTNNPPINKRKKNNIEIDLEKKNNAKSNNITNNSKNNLVEPCSLLKQKINCHKDNNIIMNSKKNKNKDIISTNRPIKQKKNEKKNEKKDMIDIKEYLSISFQENVFDEVIDEDKRTFCEYFCTVFKENQIFINAFIIKEGLRPLTLKCVVLIMYVEYFFVCMILTYDEDYLTKIFYSQSKENFFSFIRRRFDTFLFLDGISEFISKINSFFLSKKKILKEYLKEIKKRK